MTDQGERGVPVRRYTDAEVRALLERAARVEGRVAVSRPAQGLTLSELEQVAAEAQIDVGRLRQAAQELELERSTRPAGPAARLAGAPMRISVERTLPFEVDEPALQRLVGSRSGTASSRADCSVVCWAEWAAEWGWALVEPSRVRSDRWHWRSLFPLR